MYLGTYLGLGYPQHCLLVCLPAGERCNILDIIKSESGSETECEMHMGALMAVVEDATLADGTKKDKIGRGEE